MPRPFALHELGNTYADSGQRYLVSLIVGYDDAEAESPEDAVAHALALTRDDDSCRISRFLPQVVSRSLSRPRGIQAAPPG